MAEMMAAVTEKCTRQLPPIRVGETLEKRLMQLAAKDDRALSEYIRLVLLRHCYGHASSVWGDLDEGKD